LTGSLTDLSTGFESRDLLRAYNKSMGLSLETHKLPHSVWRLFLDSVCLPNVNLSCSCCHLCTMPLACKRNGFHSRHLLAAQQIKTLSETICHRTAALHSFTVKHTVLTVYHSGRITESVLSRVIFEKVSFWIQPSILCSMHNGPST